MHARVSTIYGTAEQGEEGVQSFRDEILPALKEMEGCKGAILLADRTTGKAVGITLWEDERAMQASEEAANRLRREAAETAGGGEPPTVDRYEVAVWEV
jgi:heme-degrading monooxygenase HmoA